MSTFWYTYGCRKFQVVSTPKGSIEDTDVYIINIYTSVNYETVQRKSFSRTLKSPPNQQGLIKHIQLW